MKITLEGFVILTSDDTLWGARIYPNKDKAKERMQDFFSYKLTEKYLKDKDYKIKPATVTVEVRE